MNLTPQEIKHIIETGKLKGYIDTAGFISVYLKTPRQDVYSYWEFKFLTQTEKLISVKQTTTQRPYKRWQARKYVPIIEKMLSKQLYAINKILDI